MRFTRFLKIYSLFDMPDRYSDQNVKYFFENRITKQDWITKIVEGIF